MAKELTTSVGRLRDLEKGPAASQSFGADGTRCDLESPRQPSTQESQRAEADTPATWSAFPTSRRWFIVVIASGAAIFGPLAGAIYFPALPVLEEVFEVPPETMNSTISVFMFIMAVGPLVWGPICDHSGRRLIFLVTTLIFVASNAILAVVPAHIAALFALRSFSALGSCAVTSIAAGTVVDLFHAEVRATGMALVMTGPHVFTAIGPVFGGVLATTSMWRWIFGCLAIFGFIFFMMILLLLPETLRCRVGDGLVFAKTRTWFVAPKFYQKRIVHDEVRYPLPNKLNFNGIAALIQDIIWVTVCITSGMSFGALTGTNVTLPRILMDQHGYSHTGVGFALLCSGLGLIAGSWLGAKASDRGRQQRMARHKHALQMWEEVQSRHNSIVQTEQRTVDGDKQERSESSSQGNKGSNKTATGVRITRTAQPISPLGPKPEFKIECRLTPVVAALTLVSAGLLVYGWLNHLDHAPSWSIIISTFAISFGMSCTMPIATAYMLDVSPRRAATVSAVLNAFRWACAGIIAAVANPLIKKMGIGWFFTGIAAVNLLGTVVLGLLLVRKLKPDKWERMKLAKRNGGDQDDRQ